MIDMIRDGSTVHEQSPTDANVWDGDHDTYYGQNYADGYDKSLPQEGEIISTHVFAVPTTIIQIYYKFACHSHIFGSHQYNKHANISHSIEVYRAGAWQILTGASKVNIITRSWTPGYVDSTAEGTEDVNLTNVEKMIIRAGQSNGGGDPGSHGYARIYALEARVANETYACII